MRDIKVGQEGDGQSVVLTGLIAGETVVTAGQYRLQPGSLVAAEPTPRVPRRRLPTAAPSAPDKAP